MTWLKAVYKQGGQALPGKCQHAAAHAQAQSDSYNCAVYAIHNAFVAVCESRPDYMSPEGSDGATLNTELVRHWMRQCICSAGCANHTCSKPDTCRPFPFFTALLRAGGF